MHGMDLSHLHHCYSPLEKLLFFSMLYLVIFIIILLIQNIYRFFRIKKGLRILRSHLDPRSSSSHPEKVFLNKLSTKKKQSPSLKFISDTFAAFHTLKPVTNHSMRYKAQMNHLTHENKNLFLRSNIFIILVVLTVSFGGLTFMFSLCSAIQFQLCTLGPLADLSAERLGYLFIGVFDWISYSLALQILTFIVLGLSSLAHLISKNIVKTISVQITGLEIEMLKNNHEV